VISRRIPLRLEIGVSDKVQNIVSLQCGFSPRKGMFAVRGPTSATVPNDSGFSFCARVALFGLAQSLVLLRIFRKISAPIATARPFDVDATRLFIMFLSGR